MEQKINVGAVGIVKNDRGEILLMLRAVNPGKGKWAIPSGTVGFLETAEDCFIREMREEMGIDVEIEKSLDIIQEIFEEVPSHWLLFPFVAKIVSGTVTNLEPEKHPEIKFEKIENIIRGGKFLPQYELSPMTRIVVSRYADRRDT